MNELDARGLRCPLPVLKAKKALRALAAGDVLTVHATDPSAPADFEAFAQASGHLLVRNERVGDDFVIAVRKQAKS